MTQSQVERTWLTSSESPRSRGSKCSRNSTHWWSASSRKKDAAAGRLGIFRKRKTKARMGRNPATGQEIKIPARTRLRFTAAKALKDSVLGAK